MSTEAAATSNGNTSLAIDASNQANANNVEPTVDDGSSQRPIGVRYIHLLLQEMGISSYDERVPQMLLDWSYRYLSTTLQDAALIADQRTGSSGAQNAQAFSVTKEDLRVSQAARPTRQFKPKESPEWLKTVADQINAVALPMPTRAYGIRLPPEEYCLTGIGWNLDEEFLLSDDEGDEEGEGEAETTDIKMEVDSSDKKSEEDSEMADA